MLEIVISESEKNVLNYSHLFKKNDIVSFSLLLTYGKIKDVEQNEYKAKSKNSKYVPSDEAKRKV